MRQAKSTRPAKPDFFDLQSQVLVLQNKIEMMSHFLNQTDFPEDSDTAAMLYYGFGDTVHDWVTELKQIHESAEDLESALLRTQSPAPEKARISMPHLVSGG